MEYSSLLLLFVLAPTYSNKRERATHTSSPGSAAAPKKKRKSAVGSKQAKSAADLSTESQQSASLVKKKGELYCCAGLSPGFDLIKNSYMG